MHSSVSVVYELLLRQYDGLFTECLLIYLLLYISISVLTSKNRKINFWVLLIGLLLLVASTFIYKFIVYIYYVNKYNF